MSAPRNADPYPEEAWVDVRLAQKPPLPLGESARAYLQARQAWQEACAAQLRADLAMCNAEAEMLRSWECHSDDDASGIHVDGTTLSIREEHWDHKPGDRVVVIRCGKAV